MIQNKNKQSNSRSTENYTVTGEFLCIIDDCRKHAWTYTLKKEEQHIFS